MKHERNFLLSLPLEVLLDGVLHRVDPFLEARVPIVLHCVVCATHQLLGDQGPFLAVLVAEDEQYPLLGLRPFGPLNLGVEVVEPAFAAGLTAAAVERLRQVAPHHVLVELALLVDVLENNFVLLGRPVANRVRRWLLQLCFHGDRGRLLVKELLG